MLTRTYANCLEKTYESKLASVTSFLPPAAAPWKRLLEGQRADDLFRAGPAVVTRCLGKEGG